MKIYLVGGAVRDRLLGLPVEERDWVVVGATPQEMQDRGFRQVGRDFPVFLHPDSGEEYALARTERKTGQGHRGFVVHSDTSVTLEEDLSRRDLTINAMAEAPDGQLIDPYGGRADLEARILRHVSPAFVEDPLRVLRVARFAARFAHLDFSVAGETLALMRQIAESGELATLSGERIWNEFERALEARSPAVFLHTLAACGAVQQLLPEIADVVAASERLCRGAEATDDTCARFAALASGLSAAAVDTLCDRLHAPRRYGELAALLAALEDQLCRGMSLPPSEQLGVLETADAFRRPERFERLLVAVASLHREADTHGWRRALAACEQVDAAAIAASGIPGHEIGARLRAQRLARLEG
jgi:tRNA nucleotidyltransferase (CCA-adding enzyme)